MPYASSHCINLAMPAMPLLPKTNAKCFLCSDLVFYAPSLALGKFLLLVYIRLGDILLYI